MATPSPVQASDALDELVNQFSDPLSFFRELIQNALDAGSAEVDVSIEFEPGDGEEPEGEQPKGGRGAMIIHVDDFGDGMDREIIDSRLTRLFSSAKDGDMTKIGKFGIGFVSVFAIDPEAVVVDTSRGGEHWRVIFDADRSFTRLRRDEPVDGTKIRIYKTMTREGYEDFVRRARDTVRYWCKHTRGEVRFQGELINEAFDLDVAAKVSHDDGFSKIVVAHPQDNESFFGFYNQGLTLVEGETDYMDGLAFKISSPHLEHTLTRDNVIQDKAFHKVMEDMRRLVREDLAHRVFELLAVHPGDQGHDARLEYLLGALLWHLRAGHRIGDALLEREIVPLVGGGRASLDQLRDAASGGWGKRGELLWSDVDDPLSSALRQAGRPVVRMPQDSIGMYVLSHIATSVTPEKELPDGPRLWRSGELYCLPMGSEHADGLAQHPLRGAVAELLEEYGARLSGLEFASLRYQGSSVGKRVAITQESFGEITRVEEAAELGTSLFSSKRVVVINADHMAVRSLLALAEHEPELAAYQLVKLFFLGTRLDVKTDNELAKVAVERRWQRSTS